MRRRELILGLGGAIAFPLAAHAQRTAVPTVGFLSSFAPGPNTQETVGFREGLAEEHYVEGQTVTIEYRWAEGRLDRLAGLAADLVNRRVNVIAAIAYSAAAAAKAQTASIPIVFYTAVDPIAGWLVESLAHPGGNLTGVVGLAVDLISKLVGLLRDLVPEATSIGLLVNPKSLVAKPQAEGAERAAAAANVKLVVLSASTASQLDTVFSNLKRQRIGGVIVGADVFFRDQLERIVALASRESIPAIYNDRAYPIAGGLMSYGTNFPRLYAQVGRYVGKILAGASPAELPVMEPTKFDLVINLKTAKALGLTVPPIILAQADEVIE
ncbi:MAG TPA: ABC transporter substrate-binding protein [Stellaceae bacterium]|nr:ABC transporter substrate-binding protein [Stellaceae bacterium]